VVGVLATERVRGALCCKTASCQLDLGALSAVLQFTLLMLARSSPADGTDDASTTSSVNDVPIDAELDQMIAAQQAQRAQQAIQVQGQQQRRAQPADRGQEGNGTAGQEVRPAEQLPGPPVAQPATPPKPGRRGKTVSWAEDALAPAAAAAAGAAEPAPSPLPPKGPPDLGGISLPAPALRQLQQEQKQEQEQQQQQQHAASQGAAEAPSADGTETSGSLPLTADNVARLDERLTAAEQLAAAQAGGAPPSTEQVGGQG